MSEYFRSIDATLEMNRNLKYNDFRDWFIIDEKKPYETEINFFINDEFIYKDMMPINTRIIKYKISSNVKHEMKIKSLKWEIPEMEIEKETIFKNPTMVTHFETFTVDGKIELNIV